MANEIVFPALATGVEHYARLPSGVLYWNGTEFAAFSLTLGVIPLTETGVGTGRFTADMPEGVPAGTYTPVAYLGDAEAPTVDDPLVYIHDEPIIWNGEEAAFPVPDPADAYATVGDLQARIPSQVWIPGVSSQPTEAKAEQWLVAESQWVDGVLAWKYAVPITDADDRETLREIVADLVAGRVWGTLGDTAAAQYWRRQAWTMLIYDEKAKTAGLTLPNTDSADEDEAGLGIQTGTLYIGERSPQGLYYEDLNQGL